MMAADNLGMYTLASTMTVQPLLTITPLPLASYGSLARFKDIERLYALGDSTLLGASGDMADFQQVKKMLESIM